MLNIKTVTVIGANGTMGSLVAGIIASFGDAKVYLVSRNKQDSINVINKIKKSVRSDSIEDNLIPINYEGLKTAVENSDWIYESVIEEDAVKGKLFKEINTYNLKDKIISSGTSGLSIDKLAENFSDENKKKFLGTHFFNPPYNLNLCEIIPSEYTDTTLLNEMKQYLNNVLYRDTIMVKDKPAFLANRIGFNFLNKTLQLAEKCQEKGGIDYIDNLFSGYTGRTMKPLETVDFVGLDVHKAIVDNIYFNTEDEFKDEFILPEYANKLIETGKLGKKTEEGLYRKVIADETLEKQVYDIKNKKYRKVQEYKNDIIKETSQLIKVGKYKEAYQKLVNENTEEIKLVLNLLTNYVVYSLIIADKYAENISACDNAMASGFNWCPPIAMKNIFDEIENTKKLIDEYVDKEVIEKYNIYNLIKEAKTKFDYRKYLKAI